jgi:hypothetical protein
VTPTGLTLPTLPSPLPAVNNISVTTLDAIRTTNHFYGGQIGAVVEGNYCGVFASARGKLGLGVMHQVASVDGMSIVDNNGVLSTTPGGLLSGPGDAGKHSRDRITFLPELNLRLGYAITHWLRAYVGYDTLYISNVIRPTGQTATSTSTVNATVLGTTTQVSVSQPTFRFSDTNLWVQGISFGVELRY